MGQSFKGKDKDGTRRFSSGESRLPEDAFKEEHDDSAAIAQEAATEGITVETYRHMRKNERDLYRLKRFVRLGNAEIAAVKDPKKAQQMGALLQAQINGLLGLNPNIDPVPQEPRNRGGAPKGNKNASRSRRKTTPR